MSNSLNIADVSKELVAIKMMSAKLVNINTQLNQSVKDIKNRVDEIGKNSSRNMLKITDKLSGLINLIKQNNANNKSGPSEEIKFLLKIGLLLHRLGKRKKPIISFQPVITVINKVIQKVQVINYQRIVNVVSVSVAVIVNCCCCCCGTSKEKDETKKDDPSIWEKIYKAIDIYMTLRGFIKDVFPGLLKYVLKLEKIIGQVLGWILKGGLGVLRGIFTKLIPLVARFLGRTIIAIFRGVFSLLGGLVGTIFRVIATIFTYIAGALSWPVIAIIAVIIAIVALIYIFRDEIWDFICYISEKIVEGFNAAWEFIKEGVTSFIEKALECFAAVSEFISTVISDIFNWITTKAEEVWNAITEGISTAVDKVTGIMTYLWDAIVNTAKEKLASITGFLGRFSPFKNKDDNTSDNSNISKNQPITIPGLAPKQSQSMATFLAPGKLPGMNVPPQAFVSSTEVSNTIHSNPNVVVNVAAGPTQLQLEQIRKSIGIGLYDHEKLMNRSLNGGIT